MMSYPLAGLFEYLFKFMFWLHRHLPAKQALNSKQFAKRYERIIWKILWRSGYFSRCYILVTFSYVLRYWLDRLNCNIFYWWKKMTIFYKKDSAVFHIQNQCLFFSIWFSYYIWNGPKLEIFTRDNHYGWSKIILESKLDCILHG